MASLTETVRKGYTGLILIIPTVFMGYHLMNADFYSWKFRMPNFQLTRSLPPRSSDFTAPYNMNPDSQTIDNKVASAEIVERRQELDTVNEQMKLIAQKLGKENYLSTYLALLWSESSVHHTKNQKIVKSKDGALGIAQMMPRTIEYLPEMVKFLKKKRDQSDNIVIPEDYSNEITKEDYISSLDAALEAGFLTWLYNVKKADGKILAGYVFYNGGETQGARAVRRAGTHDINVFQKYLTKRSRKESVPYAKRANALSKAIMERGFTESIMGKEVTYIMRRHDLKARQLYKDKQFGLAFKQWEDLYEITPNKHMKNKYWLGMARCYQGLEKFKQAAQIYKKISTANKNQLGQDAAHYLGKMNQELGSRG